MKKPFLLLGSLIATAMPVGVVVSCNMQPHNKNNQLVLPSQLSASDLIHKYHIVQTKTDHNNDKKINFALAGHVDDKNQFDKQDVGYGTIYESPKEVYNAVLKVLFEAAQDQRWDGTTTIADQLGIDAKQVIGAATLANIIITNNEFHIEFQTFTPTLPKVIDYLRRSDQFEIEEVNTSVGIWMGRVQFFEKPHPSWEAGTAHNTNYGITGYPLYFINHTNFAVNGVSKQPARDHQIYEVTYDHDA